MIEGTGDLPIGYRLFDYGDKDFISECTDFVGLDMNGNECTVPFGKFAEAL